MCHIFGAELSKGMDDLSRLTYLRFGVFRRFFRDFLLPGVCKVDQQNACTSKIPIREILPQEAAFCGSSQGVILCIRDIVSAPML